MADLTIAQLTELLAPAVDNLDLLPIWDDSASETKKITINNFRTAVGVTNWSETFSSATQATSRWLPNNAAANVNAAVVPKGTGALLASIPDGTAVGGNARGSYAVDLQMVRNNANQVASGGASAIVAGQRNRNESGSAFLGAGTDNRITGTAERGFLGAGESNAIDSGGSHVIVGGQSNAIAFASHSFIGGGQSNSTNNGHNAIAGGRTNALNSQPYQFIGGGQGNTGSGTHSVISGGNSNTVSGSYSNIAGGSGNTVSGSGYSTIAGGQNNTINQGSQSWQFIGGGFGNQVLNGYGVVCGGIGNIAGSGGGFTHGLAFVGGGESNRAQAEYATVVNGRDNNSVGGYSFIGCGRDNRASGGYSSIVGGFQGTAFLHGQTSHASGQFSIRGDAQAHELVWRRAVTGNGITELFLDGASAAAILPGTNCLWQGTIDIAAICTVVGNGTTTLGDAQATTYKVTIKRLGTATTLVGSVQEIGTMNADPSALGGFTIDANNTNESLRIQYTPPATAGSTTVHRVVATFKGLQIQF